MYCYLIIVVILWDTFMWQSLLISQTVFNNIVLKIIVRKEESEVVSLIPDVL